MEGRGAREAANKASAQVRVCCVSPDVVLDLM